MTTACVRSTRTLIAVNAGALLAVSFAAQAADFSARKELAERSLKVGFGRDQVQLLKRVPAPGRDTVLGQLNGMLSQYPAESLRPRGAGKRETQADRSSLTGADWFLQVYADGSRATYRNFAQLDGPGNKPVPVEKRLPQDRMEATGRRFIRESLGAFIRLAPNEQLVPLFAEYQIGGGGPTAPGAARDPEYVAGGTVVFGRVVDGVFVIGPGSKVALLFTNDARIAGFDFDWAAYERTGEAQRVVSVSEIRARAQKLTAVDLGKRAADVKRFECGYFDIGARHRDKTAPVQAACSFHLATRRIVDQTVYRKDPSSGHIMSAHVHVVPAGNPVSPDASWPLAQRFLGRSTGEPALPQEGPKPTGSVSASQR